MSIINTALIGKLKKSKADKSNVLELDNTTVFTPVNDYNPATKLYVDNLIDSQNEAVEIDYDNTTSGIVSTNVQDALDEVYINSGTKINIFSRRESEEFIATSGQTVFNTSLDLFDVEVFLNGIKLDESDYTISGSDLTLVESAELDDIVEIIDYGSQDLTGETFITGTSEPSDPHLGTVWQDISDTITIIKIWNGDSWVILGNLETSYSKTSYTIGTSEGVYDGDLSEFPVSYSIGLIEVYYDGLKLTEEEYTATNGTSITLVSPGVSGSNIEFISFAHATSEFYYNKDEVDELLAGSGKGSYETSGTSTQVIDSFDVTEYRSGEYLITVTSSSGYQTLKLITMYNGVNAINTIYGDIGDTLGVFDTSMNGDNLEIEFTPTDSVAVIQFSKTLIQL